MDARFSSLLQQQQQRNSRRAAAGGGGGGGASLRGDFSPPPSSASRFHHHNPASLHHHHRLHPSSSSVVDDPPRLFAPSGAPVPTDFCDIHSILAYRQRVNGAPPLHHSGIVSAPAPFARSQQTGVWDHSQRPPPQASLSSIHAAASLRSDVLDEAARFRLVAAREFDRHTFGAEAREDVRRNEVTLSELFGSRRSAVVTAKFLSDEGRAGGGTVPRSGIYDEPPADLNSRRRTEREEAYHDAKYFQTPQPLVERTSPAVGSRKRSREDLENGRERITRQRRVYDRGLAVLSTGGNSPLRLKRTPEIFGDPYLLRRVFSSGRNRDVEDRQEGQVTSSDRAFALQGTSSHRAFAPSVKHESHVHSFSPVTKSNQKPSVQHVGRGRALFPGRRSCSPRSESYASLPQRFDETGEKIIVTKAPGSPSGQGTNLQIRESHFRELGARDKGSMSGQHFVQLSNRKKETGGGANQQLGRLDHSGPFSGQKRSKKGVMGTGGTPLKEQENSFSRKHLTASGQKGHRPSRSSGKSAKIVEATPRKRVKSQVSRVIERTAVVCKGSPESRQSKLKDQRIIVEPHPAESIARACEEEENVHDVRQGEKIQRIDPVIQQNVGDGEHGHDDTGLGKHYQMVHTDSHGGHMLTNIDEVLQSRSLKLSVASPLPCQNPLPFSEYRREALYEKSASPQSSQLIPHNRMPFNILESSFSPSKQHGIGASLGTGWYSTLGSSLPSLTVCPQLQQSSSAVMQQLEGLSTKEGAVPSSLHEGFLHSRGQIKADLLPLNSCVDVGAETSDRLMGKELRQMNESLPVILDMQNFPQSSLARPSKVHTPTSAAEIESYPYLDVSTPYNVTGNIQTLSSPGFAQPLEQPTRTSIDGSTNFYHLAVAASLDRKVDISMESSDKLAEADEILGNAAKETTTKMADWFSGITLKAVSTTELIQQSEEAFPVPDELFHRKSKQGFSFTDLHLEQMGTSALSPSMTASEVSLSAVDLSKEETPISEAGRLGSGSKPDASSSLVGHDKQGNQAPLKQFSMATPLPRGRMAPLPARAGARTWHRPAGIDGLTGSQAMSKTVKINATKPISQGPGKQKVSQLASYVRKGNSLVRAPILYTSVVSSGLNTAPLHGAGKDTAGKVFPSFSRSQRMYQNVRTATKITRNSFRKVFPAREMPLNEPTENLPAEPHNLDNSMLQGGHGAGISHASAKAMSPGTPESQPKALPLAKSAGDDESIQQSVQILRTNIVDGKLDDIKPASLEVTSSMLNKSKLVCPSIQSSNAALKNSETSSMYYVKSKANQLIASLPPPSLVLTKAEEQSGLPHSGASAQDLYYKRKNNQIVRNGTEIKDASTGLLKSPLMLEVTKGRTNAIRQTTLGKALRQKRANLPSSRVWTLNGEVASQVKGAIPLLFPWKRPGLGVAVRAGRFKALPKAKKGSLLFLISKKLQRLRKLHPVYTRSACGFSLHRSGVLSLSGANLKWTKSIEKRSKQASEEATKAVAAVEKKRREEKEAVAEAANAVAKAKAERRAVRGSKLHPRERIVMIGLVHYKMDASQQTLQRMPDEWSRGSDKTSASRQGINSAILSTPRRLSVGGMEYVRVGNGHQLVRDPKAASRALASEKVRWSLHTARFRHAKKKQYCLFFTRFGKCSKGEGACPYIHDSEKVAVCTKFLMGTCSGTDCLLTHRVIPERMPDCSFFLEGLCTNENCPYRHVSVNPKAPICEGFLKGYCADGDECNKKHTSVCPAFSETGECSDRSTCKLHHPKKKGKRVIYVNPGRVGLRRKRRYFVTGNLGMGEQGSLPSVEENREGDFTPLDMGNTDFIGLPNLEIDLSDIADDFKRKLAFIKQKLPLLQKDFHRGEEDIYIKPILLLQRHAESVLA